MPKTKIILDVDTGSDDAVAIMTAALSPDIDLLGLTVTHGNQPLEYTLDSTLRVANYLDLDVEVYEGAKDPIVKTLFRGREQMLEVLDISSIIVDGKEESLHEKGCGLPETDRKKNPEMAAVYIVNTLRNSDEKITLVPVGPCTNIAMALRLAPDITEKIERIVLMGGGDGWGNRSAAAEFNFYADPEAAKIVLTCGVPVTIVPLNATHSAKFSYEDAKAFTDLGTKAGIYTGELIKHRIDFEYLQDNGSTEGTAVHDALTVCGIIDPSIFIETKTLPCDVDCGGHITDGQMIVDHRSFNKEEANTTVVYKIDKEKTLKLLMDIMK